jgi:hypothetical protein
MRMISIVVFPLIVLAVIYAAFDLRRDHNLISSIREDCRQKYSEARKVTECIVDSGLRHAGQPELP